MKKTNVVQPVAMASAFAEGVYSSTSTSNFEIPAATSTSADDTCVLDDGFLPITSTDLDDGGIAPERKNFNGMFYLSTDQRFYLQNGGFITYNAAVATAIGGYPQDAILGYIDGDGAYKLVRSLIDDNTYNFITTPSYIDGTHWEEVPMGGSSRNIGEIVSSTIPLTDAGLHLLDGALLQYGSYQAFIDYIADLYDSGNYTAIFDTEANWQAAVTTYGECGKFVYDSVNNTVRLPKISGFIEAGTTSTVGNLVQAGLPNITGSLIRGSSGTVGIYNAGTGAFSVSTSSSQGIYGTTSSGFYTDVDLDASNSNSIYGNSNTVQPQAIKVLYYIVVSTTTKTSIDVDIDEIATDLNGKADVDLLNINASCKPIDGQWVKADTIIASSVTANNNTGVLEYSLSSYLPNDNYNYEVIFTAWGKGGASNSGAYCYLFTDLVGEIVNDVSYTAHIFRASGTAEASGAVILPVGTGRKLKMYCTNNSNATITTIRAIGYRRIGTNA